MFKLKLPQPNQGFTLVEVLVAILITTLFVSVAMQSMVIAAIFKARAQEFSEATTWIQEDLENIKYQAANFTLASTSLTTDVSSTDTVLPVASVNGFQPGDTLVVGNDSTSNTIASVDTTANSITLTAALDTSWLANTVIAANSPMCNPAVGARNAGFADGLRDRITTPSTNDFSTDSFPKTSNRTNKPFTMTRTTTLANTAPYNVLEVSYTITPTSGGSSVASFYTEVIPNAALQCPQN